MMRGRRMLGQRHINYFGTFINQRFQKTTEGYGKQTGIEFGALADQFPVTFRGGAAWDTPPSRVAFFFWFELLLYLAHRLAVP